MPRVVNLFGCYFFSILYLAERRAGKLLSIADIVNVYGKARAQKIPGTALTVIGPEVYDKLGNLTDGCTINDPVALANLVGLPVKSVTKTSSAQLVPPGGYEVLVFHRNADTPVGMKNAEHTHFVAGDGTGKVAFDPLGQSNTVKYGNLIGKRILV